MSYTAGSGAEGSIGCTQILKTTPPIAMANRGMRIRSSLLGKDLPRQVILEAAEQPCLTPAQHGAPIPVCGRTLERDDPLQLLLNT